MPASSGTPASSEQRLARFASPERSLGRAGEAGAVLGPFAVAQD